MRIARLRENKICLTCGKSFTKKLKESHSQFDTKVFCSTACIWVGRHHTQESNRKNSLSHIGKPAWWKKGELNYFWRGGKTSEILAARMSLEYKNWRRRIFQRDNYTCQDCGQRGNKLNADHIKSFTHFPSLRYKLSNGRTLCVPCHIKTPTFGGKSRS